MAGRRPPVCPTCDGSLRRGERNEQLTYQGQSMRYLQPGWFCATCDDGILEGEDNEVHDAALHELMARARHSPISPLMIRAAREAVGASQREAGSLFGGGANAFYKYESGKATPSAGMAHLLRLALERPELFQKRARGQVRWPSAADVALIRRAAADDRLGRILSKLYPAEYAESAAVESAV